MMYRYGILAIGELDILACQLFFMELQLYFFNFAIWCYT